VAKVETSNSDRIISLRLQCVVKKHNKMSILLIVIMIDCCINMTKHISTVCGKMQ